LLHSCDHPWCVNPEHLSEDTQSENEQEYVYKDQCRQGHLFDEDNTYQYLDRRICKACKRIRQLKKRIGRAKPLEPARLSTEELVREDLEEVVEPGHMPFNLPMVPVEWPPHQSHIVG
jgi:hypothetical protein